MHDDPDRAQLPRTRPTTTALRCVGSGPAGLLPAGPGAPLLEGSDGPFQSVEAELWAPLFDYGRQRGELRDDLTDMTRRVSFVQFLFVGRSEFLRAPDAVRHYPHRFVVPALSRGAQQDPPG